MSGIYNASWITNMQFLPFSDVNPLAADTIGMYFMGVYFYLIIAQFLPATVVSVWLSSLHLLCKCSLTILLMVRFVDDIYFSEVWISEVFRPLFVSWVLLCVYGLVKIFNLNTIHSRNSVTHLIFNFLLVCNFFARPPKAFSTWLLPPNELMVDPLNDLLVTMAEMEASILNFLMVSSEIVASSAEFSRFVLFHYFWSGRPLCQVVELSLLQLAALRALRISY